MASQRICPRVSLWSRETLVEYCSFSKWRLPATIKTGFAERKELSNRSHGHNKLESKELDHVNDCLIPTFLANHSLHLDIRLFHKDIKIKEPIAWYQMKRANEKPLSRDMPWRSFSFEISMSLVYWLFIRWIQCLSSIASLEFLFKQKEIHWREQRLERHFIWRLLRGSVVRNWN